jgi:hypothetical protein
LKKVFVLILLSFMCCVSAGSFAGDEKKITVFFTGNAEGEVKTILQCNKEMWGGLPRRIERLQALRREHKDVLVLESGGVFANKGPDDRMRANIIMRAMYEAGYDVMNLIGSDFYMGPDFLKEVGSTVAFSMISSNLVYKDASLKPFWERYVIKEVGGVKVGILGIMRPKAFEKAPNPEELKNMDIISPEDALKELVPQVRKQADILILMSQLGREPSAFIVNAVKDIDFVIYAGHGDGGCGGNAEEQSEINMLKSGFYGVEIGSLQLTPDKGKITHSESKMIPLDKKYPSEGLFFTMFDELRAKVMADAGQPVPKTEYVKIGQKGEESEPADKPAITDAPVPASVSPAPVFQETPENKEIAESIRSLWEARAKKDWGAVYDMATDAYKKEVKLETFIANANINVRKFSIKDIEIGEPGKKAIALIDYEFNQKGFTFNTTAKEEWITEKGKWRLNMQPTVKEKP